jgi:hypothetical protein
VIPVLSVSDTTVRASLWVVTLLELNQIQFQGQTYPSGAGTLSGFLGDRRVSHLGWDSTHTVQQMETHPEMRGQGIMRETWNEGVQRAGYLRHSPERTPAGDRFARAESKVSGKKLPRRTGTPEYTSNVEWS